MARKSIEHLTLVPPTTSEPIPLAPVPGELSPAEAKLWTQVVESKPADWFGADSWPVLREYVRAAVMCDHLATVIAGASRDQLKRALDMRDRESRRAVSLATKLRLTQQSKYDPRGAATADRRAGGKRPWHKNTTNHQRKD